MRHNFPLSQDTIDRIKTDSTAKITIDLANIDNAVFTRPIHVFVYMRNMHLNMCQVVLDFQNLSCEKKTEYLIDYMYGTIETNIKELNSSWTRLIRRFDNCEYQNIGTILTEAEESKFISMHSDLILEVMSVIKGGIETVSELWLDKHYSPQSFMSSAVNSNFANLFEHFSVYLDYIPWKNTIQSRCPRSWKTSIPFSLLEHIQTNSKSTILIYGKKTKDWNIFQNLLCKLSQITKE